MQFFKIFNFSQKSPIFNKTFLANHVEVTRVFSFFPQDPGRPEWPRHPRLLRDHQKAHGHVHDQEQSRRREIQRPLGVCGRRLADDGERLVVQQEDLQGLQILLKGKELSPVSLITSLRTALKVS